MDYVFQNAAGRSIGGWTVPQESAGYSVSLSRLTTWRLIILGCTRQLIPRCFIYRWWSIRPRTTTW
ncbi:hypothetical protein QY880_10605 [Latilactobacillus sakei]